MKQLTVTINLTDEMYEVLEKLGKKRSLLTPNETTELDEVVENLIGIGLTNYENYCNKKYPTMDEELYHLDALRLYLPHFSQAVGFKIPFNEFVAFAANLSREVIFDLLEFSSEELKNHGWWQTWLDDRQEKYFEMGKRTYYPLEPKVEVTGTFIQAKQKFPKRISDTNENTKNDQRENDTDQENESNDNPNNLN
jgi:hypothetical protein